jgi:hypothetical protein
LEASREAWHQSQRQEAEGRNLDIAKKKLRSAENYC